MNNLNYYEKYSSSWSEDSIRLIVTASDLARSLFFYVQEVGHFKTFIPYFTERENLDSYQLIYTVSGKGRLNYLGQTFDLNPGSIVLINCNIRHHYETVSPEGWETLWVHYNGTQALGFYEEYCRNGFSVITLRDDSRCRELLEEILTLNREQSVTAEIVSHSNLTQILTELLLHGGSHSGGNLHIPEFVEQAKKWVDLHFREEFSLDELADAVGISKYHLSREFKKHIGLTINKYTLHLRITYAKELLKYTSRSVQEICYACGMNNISYFIRAFRDMEELTPNQYRKQWG